MRGSAAKATLAFVLLPAVLVAVLVIDIATDGYETPLLEDVAITLVVAIVGVFGFLLARKVPSNPIGLLLIAEGVALAVSGLAEEWAAYGLAHTGSQPGARLAAVWDTEGWPAIFAPLVALLFVFPDGRLPGPRWRKAAIGGAIAFGLTITAGVLGTARLWRTETGEQVAVLRLGAGFVVEAGFSPDGRSVVTAHEDGSVAVWPVGPRRPRPTFGW